MRSLFLLLLFTCHLLYGEDLEDISQIELSLSADCEPLTTVADCVNLVSGQFFQVDCDLISNTIDPIRLIRYYESKNSMQSFLGLGFGCQFPLFASEMQTQLKHFHALISERDGFLIPYRGKIEEKRCKIDPRILKKGYTNTGRNHLVNCQAIYKDHSWRVKLGNGFKRFYKNPIKLSKEKREQIGFPAEFMYLLKEEIKPNGNRVLFNYQMVEGKPYLSKIRTLNRVGNTTLNELKLTYSSDGCQIESSCGRAAFYEQKTKAYKKSDKTILQKALFSQKGAISYKYDNSSCVNRINKPQRGFVHVNYNKNEQVESLQEPIGPNGETVYSWRFQYQKSDTKVWDALGHLAVYRFDTNSRLSRIDYLDQMQIARQEAFHWSTDPEQEGWLKSKAIQLANQIFCLHSYCYDERGNVIRKTLYGNLTGDKPDTFQHKSKTDSYSLEYQYSEDNLLIQKNTPQGWTTIYAYLPETNLCTHEWQVYQGKIQERTFTSYDDNGQVQLIMEDDGSGQFADNLTDVTYRRMKSFHADTNPASFGKPKFIIEAYLDFSNGQTKRLKRTELFYDSQGHEIKREVYDSQDVFCYAITKSYDSRGRLVLETNPLGQAIRYKYDENNQKTEEEGFGKIIYYGYDAANRLIKKEERHTNQVFTTLYAYDALNQLTSQTDSYGNQTHYIYDRFGRQIKCIKPAIENPDGIILQPSTSKQYNILNQAISKTDENGLTTLYTYNTYGSPTLITHPDGSKESFIYYLCGWLKQKWQADGTSICYTYDPKGRVTKKRLLDAKGQLVKEEEFGYKGALLNHKKDAMGLVTTYHYDGAGRKIAEIIGQLKNTTYEYDDFGRIIKIYQGDQIEAYAYDWLDRITQKTWQDRQGNICAKETYGYDDQGNQTQKKIFQTENKSANYFSHYGSDGKCLWREDPLGNRTTRSYNHSHRNGIGQCVQSRTIIDPLGRQILEADDAFHRVARQDLWEAGKQLSCLHFFYDPRGQLIKQQAFVMADGHFIRHYTVHRTYNSQGLVETEDIQGKVTRYAYDSMGRLIKKGKPDGVHLCYTYDALGRLATLTSTDGSVKYSYAYDLHDNLIEVQGKYITQRRTYDLFNRLTKEELSPGLVIRYAYDILDRLTEVTLPDGSRILYLYDAFHLKQIQRLNPFGEIVYTCKCSAYDMAGHLLQTTTPAGDTMYTYDLIGRATQTKAPHWQSELETFDSAGNLLAMKQKDPEGEFTEQFAYDSFNHLIKESNHHYSYDSLGNCLWKNGQQQIINSLNQLINEESYDVNGNLIAKGSVNYTYDALDRLIACEKEGIKATFIYDSFDRCLQITDATGTKQLLYQKDQEIGSLSHGKIQELRFVHQEKTFAIELQGEVFFAIQDYRGNICALQKEGGQIDQWMRHTAFGSSDKKMLSPWRFANRREIAGLILFSHRFYNPSINRWQTQDPLGFKGGLNLYTYVHNNPFYYGDPDGQFALAIPILQFTFGVALSPFIGPTMAAVGTAALLYGSYQLITYADTWMDNRFNQNQTEQLEESQQEEESRQTEKDNIKNGEGRNRFKPHPNATGAHTVTRRDPNTGEITHYETYKPQTNSQNPNPWESEKRYDGQGRGHTNKPLGKKIETPHIHDPNYPGGVRPPADWEVPG